MEISLFYPGVQPDYHVYEALQIFGDAGIVLALHPNSDNLLIRVTGDNGAVLELTPPDPAVTDNKELVRDLYCRISEFTGYRSPWGCLTGVRPTKIVNQLLAAGRSRSEVRDELTGFYCARPVKAKLALTTAANQKAFLAEQAADPSRIGIYIGIPFCPTRCVYCSFTSNSIEKYRGRVDEYLRLLRAEMEAVADLVREQSLKLESVYIGGGTPTSLSEPQFARLIDDAAELFTSRSAYLREFSVEAGRPDSITAGKLAAMRAAGVNRISINPQTMNDATLELIGRRHTAADTLRAFELARAQGFDNINADIICGLPGENFGMFSHTLDVLETLAPESVTVHTLSVKRAADLKRDSRRELLRSNVTGRMVGSACRRLTTRGLRPYYMYRQKNMLGNHENVSYCLPGHESPYNIHIMEEDQTILALGAGGVSKRVTPGVIRRAFNVKSVEEYLARSTEMAARKRALFEEAKRNGTI